MVVRYKNNRESTISFASETPRLVYQLAWQRRKSTRSYRHIIYGIAIYLYNYSNYWINLTGFSIGSLGYFQQPKLDRASWNMISRLALPFFIDMEWTCIILIHQDKERMLWPTIIASLLGYPFKSQGFQYSALHLGDRSVLSPLWCHQSSSYHPEGSIIANTDRTNAESSCLARRGLFISSSLSSTLDKSTQAKNFLTSSLLLSMSSQSGQSFNEQQDDDDDDLHLRSLVSQLKANVYIRILYIPTAMYALQTDSSSTPGKQRQRARADGKKRRDLIIQYIEQLRVMGNEGKIIFLSETCWDSP